jgi:hypothetical protein
MLRLYMEEITSTDHNSKVNFWASLGFMPSVNGELGLFLLSEISGSHRGDLYCLLGCDAVQSGRMLPVF